MDGVTDSMDMKLKVKSRSVMSDSLWPHGLYIPWNSPGQNAGVGSLSLLQGVFPTQGSDPGLPHCRQILYQLSHKGRHKEDVVHIYNGTQLSHKKEKNNAICYNMDGTRDYHTKWSKLDRERQISYGTAYMWNLQKWYKWTYLQKRNKLTGLENLWLWQWGRDRLRVWNWHVPLLYLK